MAYLLGIDIGTSSAKALLVDEAGAELAQAGKDYPISAPRAGWAEQHPRLWWETVCETVRAVLEQSGADPAGIAAVGLSGQMHGLVALDRARKPVRPAILWADTRSGEQVEAVYRLLGRERFAGVTRNPLASGFLLPSLLWLREHEPEHYDQTAAVLLPKDYVRLRLTGELGTDHSDASGALAFDVAGRRWATELLEELGISPALFPAVHPSAAVAGEITGDAAAQTGLRAGTPVVFGGGDQPMQSVGAGVVRPGMVSTNIGTASQVSSPVEEPRYDPQLRTQTLCHVMEGSWNLVGASLCGGISLRWFRDCFAPGRSFGELDELAADKDPGCNGLVFLPYLGGERTPHLDPHARGVFFGMGLEHELGHFARSVMEGVVFALRDSLELLTGMGVRPQQVIASGGGAASGLWRQMQADILGVPIHTTRTAEQACLGAAIAAGCGAGLYPSVRAGSEALVRLGEECCEPDRNHAQVYQERYNTFRALYRANRPLFLR